MRKEGKLLDDIGGVDIIAALGDIGALDIIGELEDIGYIGDKIIIK